MSETAPTEAALSHLLHRAVQAAADLLIGIGQNEELDRAGKRWVTLCKNKVGGRHASFPVKVDFETGRWQDENQSPY